MYSLFVNFIEEGHNRVGTVNMAYLRGLREFVYRWMGFGWIGGG